MLKRYFVIVLVCLFVQGLFLGTSAQRTMDGQLFLTASYSNGLFPQRALSQIGFEAGLGSYVISSCYWEGGVRYSPLTRMQTVGSVAAFGGFYYRLACTRNHAFNFYGGGRLFLGVDYTENSNPVEEIVVGGSNSNVQVSDLEVSPGVTKFMIGVDPGHVAEFFFIRKVAFVAFVSVPIKFMTQQQYLSGRAGLGLRFNF